MKMTSKERVIAAVRKKEADRVPVVPYISQFATTHLKVNYTRFSQDADLIADTLVTCQREFGYDACYISTDSGMEVEAMGCNVRYFEDDVPTVNSNPWKDLNLKDCKVRRPNPEKDARMPMYQAAIRKIRQMTNDEVAIIAGSDGPITICSHLRNISQLMMDFIDDPEESKRIVMEAADVTIDFCLANMRAGATICHFGDPEAMLLGPYHYKDLIWPAHQKIIKAIQNEGGIVLGHFCGDTHEILDDLVECGFDILNIDNQLGVETAKHQADRICLLGDVDPIRILREGTPADVENRVRERMDLLKGSHHFMLGSGCHFSADTPPANVRAFVEAGRKYGEY